MLKNRVKELWQEDKPVITGWCTSPDPYLAETMIRAGFDALILDMQHGMTIGPDRAGVWIQIVGQTDITPIIRVPWNEPTFIQWVLDAGAMGVIVPMVNNVQEARKAIGACRYSPLGFRSYGPNRARLIDSDYLNSANEEILCLLMIETESGVENINEIAQLPGLDGFWIGPSDLSISLGILPNQREGNERFETILKGIVEDAKRYDLQVGIMPLNTDDAIYRWKQGFNLNPVCRDTKVLLHGSLQAIEQYKQGLK